MARVYSFTLSLLLVLVVLGVGLYLGGHPSLLPAGARALFVDESGSDYERTRAALMESISANYYRPVDDERLRRASLDAMVKSLGDRFSAYLPPREAQLFAQRVSGRFEGVGMSVQPDRKGLLVAEVFEKSPAERSGIRKGDVITRVDGRTDRRHGHRGGHRADQGPTGHQRAPHVHPRRQGGREDADRRTGADRDPRGPGRGGPQGRRPARRRGRAHHLLGGRARTAAARDRPRARRGGPRPGARPEGQRRRPAPESVLVSSLFVEDGLIVSTDGRTKARREFEAEGDAIPRDIPVVVLVDGGSASASEIVTGALRDRGRATIVGQKTFGKGVFQEVEELPNGGALTLTVGEYFLPDGESIANKGIVPKVRARDLPRTARDEALPEALRAVRALVR
ncbi:MAG: S41 family peptidase [Thermoleophilaceae bacterium]